MADGGSARTFRYSAFISYSHLDEAFARRLQSRLENYHLPRRLARQDTWREGRARRLRLVFRDRSELVATDDLTQAVRDAIAESSHLIVVCSPNSIASEWVGREVEFFHQCHGPGGVLAVLVEGATPAMFHPALQYRGTDGAVCQPLAADFGRAGDGDRLALLKLVAVLAGVRLDELVQRDAHRRVRQASIAGTVALVAMAAMLVLTVVAIRARATAERAQAHGEQMIVFLLNDLRGKLKGLGHLDLLNAVNRAALAYYQGQDLSRLPAGLLEQRAVALQAEGEDEEKRGQFPAALADFQEAKRVTRALIAENPNDDARILRDAQSEYWLGAIRWRLGDYAEVHAHYLAYEASVKRLLAVVPVQEGWIREFGDAESSLGEFTMRHSFKLSEAEGYYKKAITAYQEALARDQSDAEAQDGLLNAYAYEADALRLQCKYQSALDLRTQQRTYLEAHTSMASGNVRVRAMEVAITLAIARIQMDQGMWRPAFDKLVAAEPEADALAGIDHTNADAKLNLLSLRLFEMKAWLMLSDEDRSLSKNVPDVLKQCDSDPIARSSSELQSLCDIERIGYVKRHCTDSVARCTGAMQDADTRLAAARRRQGDTLTELWGIDLPQELREFGDLDNGRKRACAS